VLLLYAASVLPALLCSNSKLFRTFEGSSLFLGLVYTFLLMVSAAFFTFDTNGYPISCLKAA
jgi:hypothetical protein